VANSVMIRLQYDALVPVQLYFNIENGSRNDSRNGSRDRSRSCLFHEFVEMLNPAKFLVSGRQVQYLHRRSSNRSGCVR
jgi:hypothetical protein